MTVLQLIESSFEFIKELKLPEKGKFSKLVYYKRLIDGEEKVFHLYIERNFDCDENCRKLIERLERIQNTKDFLCWSLNCKEKEMNNELIKKVEEECNMITTYFNAFIENHVKNINGNKSAGTRARKNLNELRKAAKEYNKLSVELNKGKDNE